MTRKEIQAVTEKVYNKVTKRYGESNHHQTLPYVTIEDTPYSDEEVPKELYGEYCSMFNEITLYWKNIPSIEVLIRTLVHEYQHYLQSPSWMTRYYKMGHIYNTHPYEVAAFGEEERWMEFLDDTMASQYMSKKDVSKLKKIKNNLFNPIIFRIFTN